jgi:hypothetical protein
MLLALCACQGTARDEDVRAESAPAQASCKPEAPISVALDARALGGDAYAITVRATPTADVASLELGLVLPPGATLSGDERASFGATTARATRVLEATVRTPGRAVQLAALARVPVEGIAMSRTAEVTLGTAAPPPRTRSYRLPDGELVEEVRP